jgi:hypothetical protein
VLRLGIQPCAGLGVKTQVPAFLGEGVHQSLRRKGTKRSLNNKKAKPKANPWTMETKMKTFLAEYRYR